MAEIDREKVIKGLELCKQDAKLCFSETECPYQCEFPRCCLKLMADALELLKEQEQAMKEKDGTISNLIAQINGISQCYERVVRCKDCKFRGVKYESGNLSCKKLPLGYSHEPDWFCADGERKEGR